MSGPGGHDVPDWNVIAKRLAPLLALDSHERHTRPVVGCDACDSAMDEARALQSEQPWNDVRTP
jgi:hypothetical protein